MSNKTIPHPTHAQHFRHGVKQHIRNLIYCPANNLYASTEGMFPYTLELRDPSTGSIVAALKHDAGETELYISCYAWKSDGSCLYTIIQSRYSYSPGEIYCWRRVPQGDAFKWISELIDLPKASKFSGIVVSQKNHLAFETDSESIALIDLETYQILDEYKLQNKGGGKTHICFNEAGTRIALCGIKQIDLMWIDHIRFKKAPIAPKIPVHYDKPSCIPLRADMNVSTCVWQKDSFIYGLTDGTVFLDGRCVLRTNQSLCSILILNDSTLLIGTEGVKTSSLIIVQLPDWNLLKRVDGFKTPVTSISAFEETKQYVLVSANNVNIDETTQPAHLYEPCVLDFGTPNLGRESASQFIDDLPI